MLSRLLFNWPYKIAALSIAIALHFYVSHINDPHIAKSVNIPVILKSMPASLQLSDATPDVTVQLNGPTSSLDLITSSSYEATVDLASAHAGSNQSLPIAITSASGTPQDIEIESATPRAAAVVLENKVRKQFTVSATFPSQSPPGLSYGAPRVVPPVASIEGPESGVNRVTHLVVHGDDAVNGENVTPGILEGFGEVIPLNAENQPVSGVAVIPEQVELRIPVTRETAVKELIVNPTIIGTPAYPVQVSSVQVQPSRLSVTGSTELLARASVLATAPLDVTGLKSDVTRQLSVSLPPGLKTQRAEPASVTVTIHVSVPAAAKPAQSPPAAAAPAA